MNLPRLIALVAICFQALGGIYAGQRLELSAGHQTSRCTYLSPLAYTGPGYGLEYEWRRPSWRGKTVGMQAIGDIDYGYLLSPVKNSRMYTLNLRLGWGAERLWDIGKGFAMAAGGTAGIDAGILYLPRNGNNPAQGLAWAGIGATLRAQHTGLRLLSKELKFSAAVEIPSFGAFFCPAYGETYYEIYVGNHSGLAHFGWWGNRPQAFFRLRADWKLGRNWLTLGFDYRYRGLECNDITTRQAQCSALAGVSF